MATILVIEDRPINRRFLVTLFEERGHVVLQAADEQEALDIAIAEKPNVVIMEALTRTASAYRFAMRLEAGSATPWPQFCARTALAPWL